MHRRRFPLKRFKRLGYEHVALNGQGYHGVAIVSKLPFETTDIRTFCDNINSRHISVAFGEKAQLAKPLVLHNFYVPAGGDIPDPARSEVRSEAEISRRDEGRATLRPRRRPAFLVGDLNLAPHEDDIWSPQQLLKVVSHTRSNAGSSWRRRPIANGSTSRASGSRFRKRPIRRRPTARRLDGGRPWPAAGPHLVCAR